MLVQASYASTWLAPRLPAFCAEFPHVDVRLLTAILTDALPPSEIDLKIRQGNGSWPAFRAAELHEDSAVAVYGPAHLARHGFSDTAALTRLPRCRCSVLTTPGDGSSSSTTPPRARNHPYRRASITVDTSLAALDVVANSDFWAIVPERFARPSVRSGRLLQVAGPVVTMRQRHYLLRRDTAEPVSWESLAFERWLRSLDDTELPLEAIRASVWPAR